MVGYSTINFPGHPTTLPSLYTLSVFHFLHGKLNSGQALAV